MYIYCPPTKKGNVFTCVCQSFCPGGVGIPGPMSFFGGGAVSISGLRSLRGMYGAGGFVQGVGMSPTNTPSPVPTDTKWWPRHIWSASGQYTSCRNAFFLQPANEVWGKVILLHLCVILFTGGSASRGVCIQGFG